MFFNTPAVLHSLFLLANRPYGRYFAQKVAIFIAFIREKSLLLPASTVIISNRLHCLAFYYLPAGQFFFPDDSNFEKAVAGYSDSLLNAENPSVRT